LAQGASRSRRQTQEIAAVELTPDDVGDVSDLLDQIEDPIGSATADGTYDGEGIYDAVLQRHPAALVIILPRSTAISSESGMTQRDDILVRSNNTDGLDSKVVPGMAGAPSSKL
jgi:hypothetical protein